MSENNRDRMKVVIDLKRYLWPSNHKAVDKKVSRRELASYDSLKVSAPLSKIVFYHAKSETGRLSPKSASSNKEYSPGQY